MKTVETVMLQTLLSAKQLVNDTHTYDFTGKGIPASEFITQLIMSHPAKDNILAVLTNTFDFNREFFQVTGHPSRADTVCEFVEYNPLEKDHSQIVIKTIKNKTGWYANESNADQAIKFNNYTPQSEPTNTHQFFAVGTYSSTDSVSIDTWQDRGEETTVPIWYTDPDTEAIVEAAAQKLMEFRANQVAH